MVIQDFILIYIYVKLETLNVDLPLRKISFLVAALFFRTCNSFFAECRKALKNDISLNE